MGNAIFFFFSDSKPVKNRQNKNSYYSVMLSYAQFPERDKEVVLPPNLNEHIVNVHKWQLLMEGGRLVSSSQA